MAENNDIECILEKGERYLIEIEPKEDIDAMEADSIISSIFGDTSENVEVVKLWFIGSNEMFDSIIEKADKLSEELKDIARNMFSEYE